MSLYYNFTWPSGPNSVVATGTFDNWSQSVTLEKTEDGSFSKLAAVEAPSPGDKIYFKYVVDGDWVVDITKKQITGSDGITNNYIDATDLAPKAAPKEEKKEVPVVAIPPAVEKKVEEPVPEPALEDIPVSVPTIPAEPVVHAQAPTPEAAALFNAISAAPGLVIPANAAEIKEFSVPAVTEAPKEEIKKPVVIKKEVLSTPIIPSVDPPKEVVPEVAEPVVPVEEEKIDETASTLTITGKQTEPEITSIDTSSVGLSADTTDDDIVVVNKHEEPPKPFVPSHAVELPTRSADTSDSVVLVDSVPTVSAPSTAETSVENTIESVSAPTTAYVSANGSPEFEKPVASSAEVIEATATETKPVITAESIEVIDPVTIESDKPAVTVPTPVVPQDTPQAVAPVVAATPKSPATAASPPPTAALPATPQSPTSPKSPTDHALAAATAAPAAAAASIAAATASITKPVAKPVEGEAEATNAPHTKTHSRGKSGKFSLKKAFKGMFNSKH